jgi:hypothetical protein
MTALDIYPSIWDRPREEDDTLEFLLGAYDGLRDFIEGAVGQGEALLVTIT